MPKRFGGAALGVIFAAAAELVKADLADITCVPPAFIEGNPAWSITRCAAPGGTKYAPEKWDMPFGYIYPSNPAPNSLRLLMHFGGYSANTTDCPTIYGGSPGMFVISNCPDTHPLQSNWGQAKGFGVWFAGRNPGDDGLSNAWRFTTSYRKAEQLYGQAIDKDAGIILTGTSLGTVTASLLPIFSQYVDASFYKDVSIIFMNVPGNLFVKKDPGDPVVGGYYVHNVALAWAPHDPATVDIRAHLDSYKQIYIGQTGSPYRDDMVFDNSFFESVCDAGRIGCFATFHSGGHNIGEKDIHMPFGSFFTNPGMQWRKDRTKVIFTHSSANHIREPDGSYAYRGHYNIGLEWRNELCESDTEYCVELRYIRRINFGPGCTYASVAAVECLSPETDAKKLIPDQPGRAIVDVTIRAVDYPGKIKFPLSAKVNWQYGKQSGVAVVAKEGEVTIGNLKMRAAGTIDGNASGYTAPDLPAATSPYTVLKLQIAGKLAGK